MVQCCVEILEVVRSAYVDYLRRGRHAMDCLNVQRFFAVPALWVLCDPLLRMVVGPRSDHLNQLVGRQGWKPAVDRPLVHILDDGWSRVGVDDCYCLA